MGIVLGRAAALFCSCFFVLKGKGCLLEFFFCCGFLLFYFLK